MMKLLVNNWYRIIADKKHTRLIIRNKRREMRFKMLDCIASCRTEKQLESCKSFIDMENDPFIKKILVSAIELKSLTISTIQRADEITKAKEEFECYRKEIMGSK